MSFNAGGYLDAGFIDIDGGGLTLAAWFYLSSNAPREDLRILSKAIDASGMGSWWLLSLDERQQRNPRLRFRLRTETADGGVSTPSLRTDDDFSRQAGWRHVAATYDGEVMTVYLDGEKAGDRMASGPVAVGPEVPVLIGASAGDVFPWHGHLDEVAIFSRALGADEILTLMNAQAP
jgi:hypothetical protein